MRARSPCLATAFFRAARISSLPRCPHEGLGAPSGRRLVQTKRCSSYGGGMRRFSNRCVAVPPPECASRCHRDQRRLAVRILEVGAVDAEPVDRILLGLEGQAARGFHLRLVAEDPVTELTG